MRNVVSGIKKLLVTMLHLRVIFFLGLLGLLVLGEQEHELFIVNGETVKENSIPYQVYLKFEDSLEEWYCGGSLISPNYVLTAGYCTLERDGAGEKVTVYLGAHNVSKSQEDTRIEMESIEIITHESLKNKQRGTGNIGLVKLPQPVTYTPAIQPVNLGSRAQANDSLVNVTAQISGWGSTDTMYYTDPDVLRASEIVIVEYFNCDDVPVFDSSTQLCGSANDTITGICDRDVGGPLIVNDTQVGIIFYSDPICAYYSPQMFMNVSSYFDWIEQHSDVVIN